MNWINSFWNDRLAGKYQKSYTWDVDLTKAVNFHTLIELYTFFLLSRAGVTSKELLNAHEILSDQFETYYPFATKKVLGGLKTDGKKVLFQQPNGSIYTVDVTLQFKLSFIKEFFKNLDFDTDTLASRFWPRGKENGIVCDPHHQFGQPTVTGTNIQSEALYRMYLAKEPIKFIAALYELSPDKIKHAIDFHKSVA